MRKFAPILILTFIASSNANSKVLYEADFEGGNVPYLEGAPKHPGGGWVDFLGGEVRGGVLRPGDGDDYYGDYNNVVPDNSAAARNATSGSNYALKTHYKAGSAHSYQLNTTIIKFPESDEVYIRWYQKWSKQFVWPNDQQKLMKIKGPSSSQNFPITGASNFINLTYGPNGSGQSYVYSDWWGDTSVYRLGDSIQGNENFQLQTDKWYCLEFRVKSNTPGQNNAVLAYWVDDDLKFELNGVSNRGTKTGGIGTVELQHVYQSNSPPAFDQPTWMDNIVIATTPIGCGNTPAAASAPATQSPPEAPLINN